ncbi:GatB/YqeY domain-containing protein [Venatoribacter cucullus]|uniref:GatB/YqeY domain-containing protein n=1 Tax=Venatoribacter cucullus TaxID=2661630 RepID=A0A9E8FTA9_9GAMM|nr:GatB/YqeY domain-containing protein [Venatoribacter cucullus]QQD22264.1 GatB/YqeY domain-containing protein [Oceanospirillaceae bacterium ASx5O]QQD24936.1 GatB/YqeY domain-containing protein [Venatoribacter cucullus]UZK04326.1 GatB/YqeY domain-containing protein [Venatoribacter cucullus]
MSTLVANIKEAVKAAMRAKEKERLNALRLITSEFKRVEVDERIEIDDARALVILDKMLKQRRDSLAQYQAAGRDDLAAVEQFEMNVISEYMPEPLSDDELAKLVADAIAQSGAASMQDMGKVMGILKPQVQGRADMAQISQQVKSQLG